MPLFPIYILMSFYKIVLGGLLGQRLKGFIIGQQQQRILNNIHTQLRRRVTVHIEPVFFYLFIQGGWITLQIESSQRYKVTVDQHKNQLTLFFIYVYSLGRRIHLCVGVGQINYFLPHFFPNGTCLPTLCIRAHAQMANIIVCFCTYTTVGS